MEMKWITQAVLGGERCQDLNPAGSHGARAAVDCSLPSAHSSAKMSSCILPRCLMQRLQMGCLELHGFLEVFGSWDWSAKCFMNLWLGYLHLKLRDYVESLDVWRPLANQMLSNPRCVFQACTLEAVAASSHRETWGGGRSSRWPRSLLCVFSFTLSGPGRQLSLFIDPKSFNQHKTATIYFGLIHSRSVDNTISMEQN